MQDEGNLYTSCKHDNVLSSTLICTMHLSSTSAQIAIFVSSIPNLPLSTTHLAMVI